MPEIRRREKVRIQLCGRLSIELDGAELVGRLRGRQVPLLFAYLVLSRDRAIARDELAEAMWPEAVPRSQDAALRTLLSRLRSALGADVVVGRDEVALELPEPVWIDVEAASAQVPRAFAALERQDARGAWALAQVPLNIAGRGLLPGVQATWLEPHRRELSELRLQALEVIGRAGLALGGTQLGSVERAGRSLIELEPFRESGYVLLMEALAAQGNVAEGLRVFERLRALLRDDLGTVPSQEAIASHQRLISPGAGTQHVTQASEPAEGETGLELPATLRARAAETLVGRSLELATMRSWWERGRERMLLLGGEPGMGKSRLHAELASEVHAAGASVLAGHAPDEALVPYQPLLEAIGHFAFHAPPAQLRAAIVHAGEAGPDIARLIPEIRRRLPDLRTSDPGDPETDRYRLFEAVAELLGEIAMRSGGSPDRPLLIVLDDLHWADRPTLLLLRHLLRSPQAGRLRVLAAYRRGEEGAAGLASTISPLRRDGLVRVLEIAGLPPADARELVRLRAGAPPSAELQAALYDETDGNPFFIEEIVRHLEESGVAPQAAGLGELRRVGLPDDVRDLISRRLERLSSDGLEWLRGAAVIGRDFEASLLEQVLSFDEERFLEALEEALDAELVAETPGRPGRYMFSHALVRETLYAGTSSARRVRTHHRVGLVLEQRAQQRAGAAETVSEGEVAALAHHFTHAGDVHDPERAITYALAAGEQATEMLANEEAAEHYSRALDVLERAYPERPARERRLALLLELGEARLRSGDRPDAWPVFREAAEIAYELGDRDSVIRAALGASRRLIQPPGLVEQELISMLELALETTAGERTVARVRLLERLCVALSSTPRREEMRRLGAEATSIAAQLGDAEAAALAASARRRAWWAPGQLERRLADSTMLLRSAREAESLELALQGHSWLMLDLLEAGDRTAVEAQIEAFEAGARTLRQPLFSWNAIVWQAMLALLDGRLADADRLAGEALASGIRVESSAASQYHVIHLLGIRREQRRSGELEKLAEQMAADHRGRTTWRAGLVLLLWDIGRPELARAELAGLFGPDGPDVPVDGDWVGIVAVLAEVACELGDVELAARIYDLLLPHADTLVVFGVGAVCWGAVSRFLGRLSLVTGRREDAVTHLEHAMRVNAAFRARVQLAHTQLDLAAALGEGTHARELVATAAETAREWELPLIAWRAQAMGATVG